MTSIYKGPRTKNQLQKYSFNKDKTGTWSQILQFWLRNGLKLPCGKSNFVGLKCPPLHCAILLCVVLGELAGVGSMAVVFGVSDM